jgi:hypothetical protein
MVMAPPHSGQEQPPVSMGGPPTTWGGAHFGLRDLRVRLLVATSTPPPQRPKPMAAGLSAELFGSSPNREIGHG